MADNQIDILIKYGLDAAKARAAVKEIDAVKAATTAAGKESVKTAAETVKATEEVVRTKKTWRDALKGLAFEYPVLGRAASLVMNPLTAAVAGITGAFALWRDKVNETTKAMGGLELPDLSEDAVGRMERAGKAWGAIAEQMGKAATGSKDLNERFKALEAQIKFFQELGLITPGQAASDRASALTAQADELERKARATLAAAGTPGSPQEEAALREQMKAAADSAGASLPGIRGRITDLRRYQSGEMGFWERMRFGYTFNQRYGGLFGSVEEALAQEESNLAGQQGIVDQFGRFEASSGTRAGNRAAIAAANADLATAAGLREQAGGFRRTAVVSGWDAAGAAAAGLGSNMAQAAQAGSANVGLIAATLTDFMGTLAQVSKLMQELRSENAQLREQISNQRRP